jgi:hypothetical protein
VLESDDGNDLRMQGPRGRRALISITSSLERKEVRPPSKAEDVPCASRHVHDGDSFHAGLWLLVTQPLAMMQPLTMTMTLQMQPGPVVSHIRLAHVQYHPDDSQ